MATRQSLHSPEYETFLEVLKKARKNAGVTQVELAKRLRQTQAFVSKSERGERRVDLIEMRLICKALKIDLKRFVNDLESALGNAHR
jgi:transcriptional regulator with XRE-family HTH domain